VNSLRERPRPAVLGGGTSGLGKLMKRKNKYNAKKSYRGDIKFDSKREATRYDDLLLLERGGLITVLELQKRIKLEGKDGPIKYASGRQAVYIADFAYFDNERKCFVVEDVKGMDTALSKLKRAICGAMGINVEIIK